ncbi:MAG: glycoside hydrolase family 43 protein [Bacteroidaceae bacterium]|nr:glycoside hydrolase family 43 protein [Bacteroidaceae bacterium]
MKTRILMLIAAIVMSATNIQAKKKMTAYLFTYFTGNAPEQEQICYALSEDGWNYTPLNDGKPVIASADIARTGCVRDPHILRGEDGYFYMVVTDMKSRLGWASNRGLVLMRSKDMVKWKTSAIHFPEKFAGTNFANVTRVWAPQTIYDPRTKRYIVYFSLLTDDGTIPYDKVYWCYANKDFTDLTGTPQLLFDMKYASIDTDIVRDDDGLLHIFFKTEGKREKGIRQFIARDFYDGSTWELQPGFCQDTREAVEGSGVFRLFDGTWVLMYDCYINGHYQFCKSSDLKTFKAVQNTETKGAFTPRHGTVMAITEKEKQRLLKAFPNTK